MLMTKKSVNYGMLMAVKIFLVHEDVFRISFFLDIGGCWIRSNNFGADRVVQWLILVLGCYPCIPVSGTGNGNGHCCAATCRPYFTQLMTARRGHQSVDYRVDIRGLCQHC